MHVWRNSVVGDAPQHEGVAICRAFGERIRADRRASTGAILNGDGLSDTHREALGYETRHGVHPTAGRIRRNHLYWLVGIRLLRERTH